MKQCDQWIACVINIFISFLLFWPTKINNLTEITYEFIMYGLSFEKVVKVVLLIRFTCVLANVIYFNAIIRDLWVIVIRS